MALINTVIDAIGTLVRVLHLEIISLSLKWKYIFLLSTFLTEAILATQLRTLVENNAQVEKERFYHYSVFHRHQLVSVHHSVYSSWNFQIYKKYIKDSNNSYKEDQGKTQLSYQKLHIIPPAKYENS